MMRLLLTMFDSVRYYIANATERGRMMDEKYKTAEEVAALAGVHVVTVWRWLRSGKINGKKFGRSWRIHIDELKKIFPEKE